MSSNKGRGESFFEKLFFTHRKTWLIFFFLITLFLGYEATHLRPDASFEKLIPLEHPYIKNMLKHQDDLEGLANFIRIAVETTEGDIFTKEYLATLEKISNKVFLMPGINRSGMRSLWTPNVRWVEVTEEGFQGGIIIPPDYDGSEKSLEKVRQNVLRSGEVGRLVADNFKSTIIYAPLYELNPKTNAPLDYQALSHQLEKEIREEFQSDTIKIHIVGFAKKVGDLIDGARQIGFFFIIAFGITAVLLFLYSRCIKGTIIPLFCSVIAVIWDLGLLHLLGFGLDPYSILVPFLIFAIAVSHGVQVMNTMTLEKMKGVDNLRAARNTFAILYIPGLLALISDAIGFFTLIFIDIGVIRELAITASLGVSAIILTNLVLLPILLSYSGVTNAAINKIQKSADRQPKLWTMLSHFAEPKIAATTLGIVLIGFLAGLYQSQYLKIGDLDEGAPELRPDSRYNKDNKFITSNYSTSADIMVIMAETPPEGCVNYEAMSMIDQLQWILENDNGVESTVSLVNVSKHTVMALNEANLKWYYLSRNDFVRNNSVSGAPTGMFNNNCSFAPILVFLEDHRAETLQNVIDTANSFIQKYPSDKIKLSLAAGNAGIEAATNQEIANVQLLMLIFVYSVVIILCLITFRSVRGAICVITPLILTSVLCNTLMTFLGIGVKVATLPVIALGVGIGVDYGIYIYSKLSRYLYHGMPLKEAYLRTLQTTGKAVSFTGITLSVGVATWAFSPIKFQADMGILLAFMFFWNMLGALIILPALARFLLKVKPRDAK